MEEIRRASEQIAFRVEPEIAGMWRGYVDEGLVPARAHHACAMLLYLWVGGKVRDAIQKTFIRFQKDNTLVAPPDLALEPGALSPEEVELLTVFRAAGSKAQQRAIAELQKIGSEAKKG